MADQELPGGWLPPQAPVGPPRPEPPVFVRPPAQQGTDALAVGSLVCAITSIALLVLSLGLSFAFSLPLGIAGWLCAARSARPGVGRTLSIIAVALSVAATIAWLVLMAAGYSPEELQRTLEHELERQRQAS